MWNKKKSKLVYNLNNPDLEYLDINDEGHLTLTLQDQTVSFVEIIKQLVTEYPQKKESSLTFRIPELIASKITHFEELFDTIKKEICFGGSFQPFYPIKVNQRKLEVETILKSSEIYGLEAGTKTEFILIKQLLKGTSRPIMCNGSKDREYFQMIKNSIDMGMNVYISIESMKEFEIAIQMIPHDQLRCFLRIKPYISAEGHWKKSVGRYSKFGFNIGSLNELITLIKTNNLQGTIYGIHSHLGSQIKDFRSIRKYIDFIISMYKYLKVEGSLTNFNAINFGGGFPINYTGELNHKFDENYLRQIISSCKEINNRLTIMLEAGRYVVASSSMVIVKVSEIRDVFNEQNFVDNTNFKEFLKNFENDLHLMDKDYDTINRLIKDTMSPFYDQRTSKIQEIITNEYHIYLLHKVIRKFLFDHPTFLQGEMANLPCYEPEKYMVGNFSIFNSICDSVLVGQYFPVIPITNLLKQPETVSRLVDITCDSDGEYSQFYSQNSQELLFTRDFFPITSNETRINHGIPIPDTSSVLGSYLVIPLVGAYQDIIEFDHNLIGDLPDIGIFLQDNNFRSVLLERSESIEDLAKQVGFKILEKRNESVYLQK